MTEAVEAVALEAVIGLEVHAQLLTRSKMFCGCSAQQFVTVDGGAPAPAPPNSLVCPVCLGLPGVLPAINGRAVELTVMTGLALGCEIAEFTRFDRKNYFYPDLPKGYQISQYDLPLCHGGVLAYEHRGETCRAGIRRVHLEEDTGKLVHRVDASGAPYSLVDLNRAGVPLMEIVGEPDLRGAAAAGDYLRALRSILRYIGVCSGDMEQGAFRCDANVSVRPAGSDALGVKVEVKNMNSFRAVERALEYEVVRQSEAVLRGESIAQETRGWDDARGVTVGQRSKEFAHDYRYFPEPDLPPLTLTPARVAEIGAAMPELPAARRRRFVESLGLSPYDAGVLTAERAEADFFEAVLERDPRPKVVANWVNGELRRLMNAAGLEINRVRVAPGDLAALLALVDAGTINQRQAKAVLEGMFASGKPPGAIVAEQGLSQISDEAALEAAIDEAIARNPQSVADVAAGKKQALGFLVGQVMRATGGQANPTLVNRVLAKKLGVG